MYVMQLIKSRIYFFLILKKYLLSNFVLVLLSSFSEHVAPSKFYMLWTPQKKAGPAPGGQM